VIIPFLIWLDSLGGELPLDPSDRNPVPPCQLLPSSDDSPAQDRVCAIEVPWEQIVPRSSDEDDWRPMFRSLEERVHPGVRGRLVGLETNYWVSCGICRSNTLTSAVYAHSGVSPKRESAVHASERHSPMRDDYTAVMGPNVASGRSARHFPAHTRRQTHGAPKASRRYPKATRPNMYRPDWKAR
jgi:hypothetical protein